MKSLNTGQPPVSVIMPTFNHAGFIGKAIDSVFNQTYQNFELIIVDNYSEDDTEKIVTSYKDDRIKYFKFRNNGIIAASRNHGIMKSKGEYIAFLDSDDIWYPDKLDCQLSKLSNSSSGLCFTNFDYINKNGKKLKKTHRIKKRYLNPTFNKFILGGGGICNSSVMIIRNVINTVGLLKEDSQLIAVEDYHYWARILKKYKACCVDKVLVSYRMNSPNSMQAITDTNWLKKEVYLLNSIYSSVKINKAIYYIKLGKLVALRMLGK